MDGVLVLSEPHWFTAMNRVLEKFNYSLSLGEFEKTQGIRIDMALRLQYENRSWGDGKQVESLTSEVMAVMVELIKEDPRPGKRLRETLEALREEKIPLALVSSSPWSLIHAVLDTLNIREYFSVLCSGEEVTQSKPHPEIYRLALERMNITQPERVTVIEDSASGVTAAAAAGCQVIALNEETVLNKPVYKKAYLHWTELPGKIWWH